MRTKSITTECAGCDDMKANDNSQMVCHWGKGEPKILEPQKGKKPLYCKLNIVLKR
jgi:hypothetical protein